MILLEYNEEQGFHNNTIIPNQNRFSSPLFSYGWKPVCVIADHLTLDPEYEELTDHLENKHADYETVVRAVTYWVMNKQEQLEDE